MLYYIKFTASYSISIIQTVITCVTLCTPPSLQPVRDRVLATAQSVKALYKKLEERILMTQKKQLARRAQGTHQDITLFNTLGGRV